MSFDGQSGELFVGDVGWELWESVHRVEKGGNYGWSAMEGPQAIKPEKVGPTPIRPALIELPHTIACSVTGGSGHRPKQATRPRRGRQPPGRRTRPHRCRRLPEAQRLRKP